MIENIKTISNIILGKHRKFTVGLIYLIFGILIFTDISITDEDINFTMQVNHYLGWLLIVLSILTFFVYIYEEKSLYETSIKTHRIFSVLSNEISKKNFGDKEEFLSIKFETWIKYLEKITQSKEVIEYDYSEQGGSKLYEYMIKKQEEAIKEYERDWKDKGFTKETIETFNELHKQNLQLIMNHLSTILDSDFTKNPNSRLVVICNAHLFMFDLSKSVIEQAIKDGRLKIEKDV